MFKTRNEIDEVIGNCLDQMEQGSSKYPGMSYEEGVEAALRWVTGDSDDEGFPFGNEE